MEFDNRSLVVAVAVATLLCTAARFLLLRMHPAMPGLARWAWAGVVGVCALGLFTAAGHMPPWMSLGLSQILLVAGFLLSWDGFRRFLGRKPLTPRGVLLVASAPLVTMIWACLQGSQAVRSMVGSLAIAGATALIARELLRAGSSSRVAVRTTGWVYAATMIFFLVRAAAIAAGSEPELALQSDHFTSASLLWSLAMILATTLGMALMAGERLQEELNHQASRDPLTGALNRRAFALLAQKAMAHSRRQGNGLAVLAMDLDHFKQINDRHGHAVGDAYLCRFVAIAERSLRAEDVVCRFGGEEFVALMPGASLSQALLAAERLRTAFAQEVRSDPALPLAATVSIGVGELAEGETIEGLLQRADAALYCAKRSGRNRCDVAQPSAPQAEPAKEKPA